MRCINPAAARDGLVPTESELDIAACDARCVFGVVEVLNRIEAKA